MLHFSGSFGHSSRIQQAVSWVETHTLSEVSAIRNALRMHKADTDAARAAVLALSNFVAGLSSDPALDSFEVSHDLRGAFENTFRDVVDVMSIHADNVDVVRNALRLLRVSLFLADQDELLRWAPMTVEKTIEAIFNFPTDLEILLSCCLSLSGILEGVESDDSVSVIGRNDTVNALFDVLAVDSEELVEIASDVLAKAAKRVLPIIAEIVEHPNAITTIITCMFQFPRSWKIQANSCSILESIATLHDHIVKTLIANSGGVSAVLEALSNHHGSETVQMYGFKALSSLLAGVHDDIIEQMRDNIGNSVEYSLSAYIANDGIVAPILEVFWSLSRKYPYFKHYFKEAIPIVVEAMSLHLSCCRLQLAACSSLWTLAYRNDENKRLIGVCGGLRAIVHAILFHIDVKMLQKEALTAVQNLATTPRNKEELRQRGVSAILFSMWVNMDSADILSAALKALNNIIVDTENRQVSPISEETLQCIFFAMGRFPFSAAVQKDACFLLQNLTYEYSNLALMQSQREEITRLLCLAASSFSAACGMNASYILDKL
jgi:hypothetical protein